MSNILLYHIIKIKVNKNNKNVLTILLWYIIIKHDNKKSSLTTYLSPGYFERIIIRYDFTNAMKPPCKKRLWPVANNAVLSRVYKRSNLKRLAWDTNHRFWRESFQKKLKFMYYNVRKLFSDFFEVALFLFCQERKGERKENEKNLYCRTGYWFY